MITHLVIPKQSGTSDTCVAEDEEDIFLFQEPRDLITLGWIHVSARKSCFLLFDFFFNNLWVEKNERNV